MEDEGTIMAESTSTKSKRLLEDPEVENKIKMIKTSPLDYPPPHRPTLPLLINPTMSMKRKLCAIQRYISAFGYNYTGQTYVSLRRDKGMKHLVFAAKVIMRECLPIQCVEALFIAVNMTNGMDGLLRLPISFRSRTEGTTYHHIVLGLRHKNKWGAIGISRLSKLMYKPMRYESLLHLIQEFESSYKDYHHDLCGIGLGLPFSHDNVSETPLQWKVMKLSLHGGLTCKDISDAFNHYSKDCEVIYLHFDITGKYPKWCTEEYRKGYGKVAQRFSKHI